MSALDLPVAVSLVSNNRSGSVFTNLAAGLALIRWTSHANLSYCVDLEATAFQDMAMANSDTLLYELQDLPWECSGVVTQALIHDALLENLVQTLVCVGKLAELNHQPAAGELHALAKAQGKNALFADSFSEATTWINAQRTGQRPLQPANPPLNFKSGYAGSVYSLPQYSTTVICLSGVMDDYRAIMKLLRHAFSLHRHTKARTCVIDTSSCPPLAADTQYTFVYREAVQPLTSGNFDMIIHIRVPGDALWAHGEGMTISQLVTSLGVPYFEVGNMQECLSLLNALQGKEPRVRPSTLPGEGDLPFPPPDQPFKH